MVNSYDSLDMEFDYTKTDHTKYTKIYRTKSSLQPEVFGKRNIRARIWNSIPLEIDWTDS